MTEVDKSKLTETDFRMLLTEEDKELLTKLTNDLRVLGNDLANTYQQLSLRVGEIERHVHRVVEYRKVEPPMVSRPVKTRKRNTETKVAKPAKVDIQL